MKIGIVTGEISGNILGAGLMQALRQHHPAIEFSGIGGPEMNQLGCDSLYDMERLAVMGLVEPLKRLPELFNIRHGLYQHFTRHKPDVFIGIDAPDFNLGLEHKLRQQGIPVIHYVSPSVWAWRKKRIHKIAKATDLVLTLFPFEAAFYEAHQVPARFVGHPLADSIPIEPDKAAARKKLHLEPDATYIALLPGSRKNELRYLAETFIKTAKLCWKEQPNLKFISSMVNAERHHEFLSLCQQLAPELPLNNYIGCTHDVMAAADVVLVTSGTATLETLLFKRPMVIAYRMANLTYQIARHLVKIPYIGLPNLLADRALVPEFIQDAATPAALSAALLDYVDHPEKAQALSQEFTRIHHSLRCDANTQAAEAVMALLAARA